MFNTSLDILYLVLSLSALLLTVFLCLALYQFIVSARKINRLASAAEKMAIKGEELISFLHDRIGHGTALVMGLAEVIKKVIASFSGKKESKKKAK
ncbi:MAG: hypothetical protein NT165_01820 [Candidatus Falkowbacteria bacterium]|nr:hypothetical protein [Candidatus Falkowbacteria bacterium]